MQARLDDRAATLFSLEESLLEELGFGLALLDLDSTFSSTSPSLCALLGRASSELLGMPSAALFRAQDPDADYERARLLSGELPAYSCRMTSTHNDGHSIWVRASFALVRGGNSHSADAILMVVEDVTPLRRMRKALRESERAREEVARRLINAQEAERRKIARELHDDIGQSLAVLKIQMMQAGKPSRRKSSPPYLNFSELARAVQEIATKVGHLSHELHSSELEFLGLAVAIKSHCREVAERFGIAVQCSCASIPEGLDSELSLCLLRVAQEALHNIAKHAHATKVCVELVGTKNELGLTVTDNGIGFDVDASRLSLGLGLVSMRERMLLVSGELTASSKVGDGTTIQARAPIRAKESQSSESRINTSSQAVVEG